MRAIIVEDSRLARQGLKKQLLEHPVVEVVGEAENADDAIEIIQHHNPDVLFLDIHMPGKDGFEMLLDLPYCPRIIFTTAYMEYAIRSFDFNTVDYLLKPIRPERLAVAIEKLMVSQDKAVFNEDKLNEDSQIFVKDGDDSFLIEIAQIRYFESCGNYTKVYFADDAPLIYKSLSKIERRLPEAMFFRVSRQQLINLKWVDRVEEGISGGYNLTLKTGEEIQVSRNHSSRLRSLYSL
ncbi:Transcriptional regulatory protein YehT [Thalassocella blandensis]|nr:Transcriptional regulatory protein YehT [Thalassocella blandensis]